MTLLYHVLSPELDRNVKKLVEPFRYICSINPNRSSLMIARLESSFELSSFPFGQISICFEIHLELYQVHKQFQVLYQE